MLHHYALLMGRRQTSSHEAIWCDRGGKKKKKADCLQTAAALFTLYEGGRRSGVTHLFNSNIKRQNGFRFVSTFTVTSLLSVNFSLIFPGATEGPRFTRSRAGPASEYYLSRRTRRGLLKGYSIHPSICPCSIGGTRFIPGLSTALGKGRIKCINCSLLAYV